MPRPSLHCIPSSIKYQSPNYAVNVQGMSKCKVHASSILVLWNLVLLMCGSGERSPKHWHLSLEVIVTTDGLSWVLSEFWMLLAVFMPWWRAEAEVLGRGVGLSWVFGLINDWMALCSWILNFSWWGRELNPEVLSCWFHVTQIFSKPYHSSSARLGWNSQLASRLHASCLYGKLCDAAEAIYLILPTYLKFFCRISCLVLQLRILCDFIHHSICLPQITNPTAHFQFSLHEAQST